ncbi:MAG: prolyl oligopeptidase family serine peptidase [Planctomycetia bacterium]|nr:prolyl oligopeptidase family serine peptidase [Planctomycetia bacterium]
MVAVATLCLSNRLSRADESAAANSAQHDDIVHTLTTHEGVEFGFWGRIDNTVQPTLIVLSGTIEGTLTNPYFRQCGNQLARESGWLCVSIDLPCHGTQHREGESGLSGWRERVENGDDFVKQFNQRLSGVLDYLIDNGFSDPKRIAVCGTSRGGFLAIHFAASDTRVGYIAGFAPVTDLAMLSEFKGIEDNPLTKQLSAAHQAGKLTGRHVWIGIGDQDQRVSTDAAIQLARQLTIAKCQVELHVFPEPRGHTTPKGAPEMVARWILSVSGE